MKRRLSSVLMRNIFITVIAVIFLITGLLIFVVRGGITSLLADETAGTMSIIDKQIHNYLDYPINEMKTVRERLENEHLAIEEVMALYNQYEHPLSNFHHMDIIDHEGMITAVIGGDITRIGFDLSNNPVYASIKGTNKDYLIGEMQFDALVEEPTLYVVMAYEEGFMVGYINLDLVSQIFDGVNLRENYIAIVDATGKYVSHTNVNLVNERSVDPNFRLIRSGDMINGEEVTYLGNDFILHYTEVGVANLYILYYQDVKEYNEATLNMIGTGMLVIIMILPIAVYLMIRISRNIRLSFEELKYQVDKISEGDYLREESHGHYEEFNDLLNAFLEMSDEVEGREEEISNLSAVLEENYYETVVLLAKAIEAKDTYTGNHCERVTEYSMALGKELNLNSDDMRELRFGATLHDIGKISIPEQILNKPGRLTNEEYDRIKEHSRNGYEIIKDLTRMRGAKEVILYHHEKYDGTGYPTGLRGKDIPILARIAMIADAYDAMVSERPYRKGSMTKEEGLMEIRKCAGSQFDPELAMVFCQLMEKDKIF